LDDQTGAAAAAGDEGSERGSDASSGEPATAVKIMGLERCTSE
jgi:hypothetical protein